MKRYVVYLRQSTEDRAVSGLGLAAQQRDIDLFLANFAPHPHAVIGTFTDIQSGADNDRPQLQAALALVRKTRNCELLVAKLDRLSRRVSFIASLMEDRKIALRVATMPHAGDFELHVYASLSEQERKFISARTKAALAEAKARGVKLGGIRDTTVERNAAVRAGAQARALKIGPMVRSMRDKGMTLQQVADHLNAAGVRTAREGSWHPMQVKRTLARLDAVAEADSVAV